MANRVPRQTVLTPTLSRIGIILIEAALLLLLAAWVIPAGRGSSAAAGTAITFEESLSPAGVAQGQSPPLQPDTCGH